VAVGLALEASAESKFGPAMANLVGHSMMVYLLLFFPPEILGEICFCTCYILLQTASTFSKAASMHIINTVVSTSMSCLKTIRNVLS
jgi:hypothetical protein